MIFMLVLLSSCLTNTKVEPIWDTDIPESEDFNAQNAEWSQDGQRVYFQHTDLSDPNNLIVDEIWVYDFTSKQRRPVFNKSAYNIDVHQSETKFIYHKSGIPETVYEIDIMANVEKQLTNRAGINEFKNTLAPRYSPDYSKILATIIAGEPRGIIVMDSTGINPMMVVQFGIMGEWFPSGDKIIYVGWSEELQSAQIFEINLDGTNKKQLTSLENTRYLSGPVVSPDGKLIAFANIDDQSTAELFLMNYESGEVTQITQNQGFADTIAWSPSGEELIFNRVIPNVSKRLYIIDLNTYEVEPVFKKE